LERGNFHPSPDLVTYVRLAELVIRGQQRRPPIYRLAKILIGTILGRDARLRGSEWTTHLLATSHLDSGSRSSVLLHADLYQENIVFDRQSHPIFLGPLPMLGDPAFDWAFWIVYYDLGRDPVSRLAVASRVGGIPVRNLVPWCVTLCIDGLCYYRETGDVREPRMGDVLDSLAAFDDEGASC